MRPRSTIEADLTVDPGVAGTVTTGSGVSIKFDSFLQETVIILKNRIIIELIEVNLVFIVFNFCFFLILKFSLNYHFVFRKILNNKQP
jgi:hypothetical protein